VQTRPTISIPCSVAVARVISTLTSRHLQGLPVPIVSWTANILALSQPFPVSRDRITSYIRTDDIVPLVNNHHDSTRQRLSQSHTHTHTCSAHHGATPAFTTSLDPSSCWSNPNQAKSSSRTARPGLAIHTYLPPPTQRQPAYSFPTAHKAFPVGTSATKLTHTNFSDNG
jgi:hypothetical protein